MQNMKLTKITITQKGRYALFVDDNFLFSVTDLTLHEFRLKEGMEVSDELLDEVYAQAMFYKAKDAAFKALSYKGYSRGKLREKLAAKTTEDAAEQAVERMEELGLINDEDYAQRLVEYLVNVKKYGRKRILAELSKHKIDKETGLCALEEFEREDYLAGIKSRLESKYNYPRTMEKKEREKMISALLRGGHSYDDIRTAMRELEDENDYFEENSD